MKKAKQGSPEWRTLTRKLFRWIAKAAKEDRLVLIESVADNDSKQGLKVAVIAEEMEKKKEGGRLHPLGIIMDDAMWPLIEQPEGMYEIYTQTGKVKFAEGTSGEAKSRSARRVRLLLPLATQA